MYDSVKILRDRVHYDPLTGVFSYRKTRYVSKVGKPVAVSTKKGGYTHVVLDGATYLVHRLAWFYVHGEWPSRDLDHINHISDDNRIANLRECNDSENRQNLRPKGAGVTGFLGVTRTKQGKFKAGIGAPGKGPRGYVYLGTYDTVETASEVYLRAKKNMHTFVADGYVDV